MSYTRFCKTHPTYQAKRAPRADCEPCRKAFAAEEQKRQQFGAMVHALRTVYPDARQIEVRVNRQAMVRISQG